MHALLGDLSPGQTYHYRFVYSHGRQTGFTPDATFTTAPNPQARQPFTFTAYGDQGITGKPGSGLTIDNAFSLQPESSSHITDDYYDSSDPDYYNPTSTSAPSDINPDGQNGVQPGASNTPAPPPNSGGWDDFDPYVWTTYLSQIEPSSASTPWMFATGNHDVELFSAALDADAVTTRYYGSIGYGGHAQRLDLPKNGPSKCPSVYSFTYSNVAIVSVDANDLSYEIQGIRGYSDGTQAAWLKQRLAAFRADPAIDFIIAFYHHCAFSTCSSHSSDGGVRSTLGPLFAEYQVDLAIQGHNHLYERTNPIRYDAAKNSGTSSVQAVSRSPRDAAVVHPATDGTTYVVVGSAGRPRYDWGGPVESDRNFIAGVGTSAPGNGTEVPGDPAAGTGPYVSQLNFTDLYETIDWSQARYRDYAFIALDVAPAAPGATTTMTLRAINQQGVEFDRVVFSRRAGE